MKNLFATILSGFLLMSVSVFAADSDYSQTQNKVDDVDNDPKPVSSQVDQKKDQKSSDQSGAYPKGKNDNVGSKSGSMGTDTGSSGSGANSTATGASGSSSSKN